MIVLAGWLGYFLVSVLVCFVNYLRHINFDGCMAIHLPTDIIIIQPDRREGPALIVIDDMFSLIAPYVTGREHHHMKPRYVIFIIITIQKKMYFFKMFFSDLRLCVVTVVEVIALASVVKKAVVLPHSL